MMVLSHKQLENIVTFLNTRPRTPNVDILYAYFKSRLTESKVIFAVTLEYSTTIIDNSEILKLFVTEVASRTSTEEMQSFYNKRSAVTNS